MSRFTSLPSRLARSSALALCAPLAVGAATFLTSQDAEADWKTRIQWSKVEHLNSAQLDDGEFKSNTYFGGWGSGKQYPFCRTESGFITWAQVKNVGGTRYLYCDGKRGGDVLKKSVAVNSFTTEWHLQTKDRGRLPTGAVPGKYNEHGLATHVLCLGQVGPLTLPGTMKIERDADDLRCNVKAMGQMVATQNYYVMRYTQTLGIPTSHGWWTPGYAGSGDQVVPVHAFEMTPGKALCRAKDNQGVWWPGTITGSGSHLRCQAVKPKGGGGGNTGTQHTWNANSNFQIYVSPTGNPRLNPTNMDRARFGAAVKVGTKDGKGIYACQHNGYMGYLVLPDKKCKLQYPPGTHQAYIRPGHNYDLFKR